MKKGRGAVGLNSKRVVMAEAEGVEDSTASWVGVVVSVVALALAPAVAEVVALHMTSVADWVVIVLGFAAEVIAQALVD